ncbi:MAG: hypothetical protein LBH53_02885 [Puniceicoccales bacterium]|jgi:hypothetical protein|nr:hypothetical protein [Puniceicoccales bacterium]
MGGPISVAGLFEYSVYRLLDANLTPDDVDLVGGADAYLCDGNGNVYFFSPLAGSGYGRQTTDPDGGCFVQRTMPDGTVNYVHRSQVYMPNAQERERLGTLALILAVAFTGSRAQLDLMAAYAQELANGNQILEELRRIYGTCLAALSGLDQSNQWDMATFPYTFVSALMVHGLVEDGEEFITDVRLRPVHAQVRPRTHPYFAHGIYIQSIYDTRFDDGKTITLVKKDASDWANYDNWDDNTKYSDRVAEDGYNVGKYWTNNFNQDDQLEASKIAKFLSLHTTKVKGVDGPSFHGHSPASYGIGIICNSGATNTVDFFAAQSDGDKVVAADSAFSTGTISGLIWSRDTYSVDIPRFDAMRCAVKLSAADIIKNKSQIFLPLNELRSDMDTIKTVTDQQNSAMQIPSNCLATANGNMQAVFSLATGLIQELMGNFMKVTKNVRL